MAHEGTLVCPTCRIEMRPKKNGVYAVKMAGFGPVSICMADLYYCPDCEMEMLARFAKEPFIHHFEAEFGAVLAKVDVHAEAVVIRYWLNTNERDGVIPEKVSSVIDSALTALKENGDG